MMDADSSVIAIDPGYDRVGIAVFSVEKTLMHSECFTPETKIFAERLFAVKKRICEVARDFKPATLALETLFFSKNQKTALKVAEARGAILVAASELSLPVYEYSPADVKIAVTGNGAADKMAVIKMVERLVPLSPRKRLDDEFDAIAVGIAHQAAFRLSTHIST